MLTSLQIRNFRKNRRLSVKLNRVTVFRGPSGSGKSSLIGALKWASLNQPSGLNFLHWNRPMAAVRLRCESHNIIRKRSPTENVYQLDDTTLEAFGTGVPESVRNCLNMAPLNFQRQHDGPFWFQETAGEVSRRLNAIINLELIDVTLARIDKEHRDAQASLTDIKKRVENAKAEKVRLRYIIALEGRLRTLEGRETVYKGRIRRAERLNKLLREGRQHEAAIRRLPPDMTRLTEKYENWRKRKIQYERWTELLGRAEEYEESITQLSNNIHWGEKELRRLMGERCPLCGSKLK